MVRLKPKLTPDASSMVLLGPGVMDDTKAKSAKAEISSRENGILLSGSLVSGVFTLSDYRAGIALQMAIILTTHICPIK